MATDILVSSLSTTPSVGQIGVVAVAQPPAGMECLVYMQPAKVEVWAATTNNRANAAKVGETTSGMFVHGGLPNSATRYYWARAVDGDGNLGAYYPASATAGVSATTLTTTPGPGSITTDMLADRSITSDKIGIGAIIAELIANLAITEQKLAAAAVTTAKLADEAVAAGKLAANSVTNTALADAVVTAAKIADAAITAAKFASTVKPVEIFDTLVAAGAATPEGRFIYVKADDKTYRATGASWISTVAAVDVTGQLVSAQLVDGAITELKLAAAAVTSAKIATSAITEPLIANGAIVASKIADGTLTAAKFATDVAPIESFATLPTTGNFEGRVVYLKSDDKLYRYTGSAWVATVAAVDITGQVGSSQIADAAVSAAKLAAAAVTNTALADGSITAPKLVAGSITVEKLVVTGAGNALNFDPFFEDAREWALVPPEIQRKTISDGLVGSNVLFTVGSAGTAFNSGTRHTRAWAIDPTKSYLIEIVARQIAGGTRSLYGVWRFYDETGASIDSAGFAGWPGRNDAIDNFYAPSGVLLPSTWTRYAYVIGPAGASIPPNARSMTGGAILNYTGSGTLGEMQINMIRVTEMARGELIVDGSITAAKILAGSVTTEKLAAGAVTANELAAGSVIAGKIAADAVTTNTIAANAVTFGKVAAGAIGVDQLLANSVTSSKLLISNSTNLVSDSTFATGAAVDWSPTNGASQQTVVARTAPGVPANAPTPYVMKYTANGAPVISTASDALPHTNPLSGIAVVPGEQYLLSIDVASDADTNAFNLYAIYLTTAGTYQAGPTINAPVLAANGWTTRSLNITIPSNIARLHIYPFWSYSAGGNIYWTNARILRRNDGQLIVDGAITAAKLDAGSVTTAKLAAGAVTANELASNSVTAVKIVGGTITGDKLVAGTITALQLAAGAVTTAKLAAGAVTADSLAANSVTADKLAANSVIAGKVAAGAIGADQIAAKAIHANHLSIGSAINVIPNDIWTTGDASGWFKYATPANQTVVSKDASGVPAGASQLYVVRLSPASTTVSIVSHPDAHGAVGAGEPVSAGDSYQVTFEVARSAALQVAPIFYVGGYSASGALVSSAFQTLTLSADNTWEAKSISYTVPAGVVSIRCFIWWTTTSTSGGNLYLTNVRAYKRYTGELIVDGAITASKIAAESVTTTKLAAGAVTADQLAANSVTAGKVAANAILAASIASGAVTTAKLAAGAVTANELASGSVTTIKLEAGSVTASRIYAGSITATEIANSTITGAKIVGGTITGALLADATITTAKIANAAITNAKIDSLSADKLTAGTISATISITSPTINGGTITGTLLRTASSGGRIQISSSSNTLDVIDSSGNYRVTLGVVGTNSLVAASYASGATAAYFGASSNSANAYALRGTNTGSGGGYGAVGISGADGGYAVAAITGKINSPAGYSPFTGMHEMLVRKDADLGLGDIAYVVKIIARGGLDNVLAEVARTDSVGDRRAIGVVSERKPLTETQWLAALEDKPNEGIISPVRRYIVDTFDMVTVNALGEGQMDVCGRGGDIGAGDFIVTSDLAGKGQRQNDADGEADDLLRRCTVAQTMEAVAFDSPDQIKRVACFYRCG